MPNAVAARESICARGGSTRRMLAGREEPVLCKFSLKWRDCNVTHHGKARADKGLLYCCAPDVASQGFCKLVAYRCEAIQIAAWPCELCGCGQFDCAVPCYDHFFLN